MIENLIKLLGVKHDFPTSTPHQSTDVIQEKVQQTEVSVKEILKDSQHHTQGENSNPPRSNNEHELHKK